MINVTLPVDFANTLRGLSMNSFFINPLDYVFDENKAPRPPDFVETDSTLFLLNCSSLVLLIGFTALSYVCTVLLSKAPCSRVLRQYFTGLRQEYQWGVLLRIWIQLYLDLGFASLLQFYEFSWSHYGAIANGLVAGLCLTAFIASPIALLVFIKVNYRAMLGRSDTDFNKRWGILFLEFKQSNGHHSLASYPLFLFRRCMFAITLLHLHSYPSLQLLLSVTAALIVRLIQALLHLALLAQYQDKIAQTTALLGEIATFLTFVLVICFLWLEAKSQVGTVLGTVGQIIIMAGIGLNSVISLYGIGKTWVEMVRRFKQVLAHSKLHSLANASKPHTIK
jgi:hypothetical protein